MPLTLDHIVIQVADLDAAAANYRALGFTVQPGGTHADGVTHNALVVFGDGVYLELIAFLQPAPHRKWWDFGHRFGDGIVDFALLPSDVGTTISAAGKRGVAYEGPLDGGRLRPDGESLVWQTGRAPSNDLPFLCGDITPRALRVPEGAVRQHANGVQGVSSVTVAVYDLNASLRHYRALLGTEAVERSPALAAVGVATVSLALGTTSLLLVSPTGDAGSSPLAQRLAGKGEGLIGFALQSDKHDFNHVLPLQKTHGASIEIQSGG